MQHLLTIFFAMFSCAPARPIAPEVCCARIRTCEDGPPERSSGCVEKVGTSGCARIVASLARDVDDCFILSKYGHVPPADVPR